MNRLNWLLLWSAFITSVTAIGLFAGGKLFGFKGAVAGSCLMNLLGIPFLLGLLRRETDISLSDLLAAFVPVAFRFLCVAGPVAGVSILLGSRMVWAAFAVAICAEVLWLVSEVYSDPKMKSSLFKRNVKVA